MDDAERSPGARVALALGALFGDIGTSPLYAVQTVFSRDATRPSRVNPDAIAARAAVGRLLKSRGGEVVFRGWPGALPLFRGFVCVSSR
jgi:hypothetical protein